MRSGLGRAVVAAVMVCGVARAETREGVVPAGATTVLRVQAEGVQIYECAAAEGGTAGGGAAWRFREPLATLMVGGKTVGRHYAGPWWALDDGSSVRGRVVESAAGETPGDIPWLRLAVAARGGDGVLAGVTGVARVETRGGMVTGACGTVGALRLEPYSAVYLFLKE